MKPNTERDLEAVITCNHMRCLAVVPLDIKELLDEEENDKKN